MQTKFVYKPVDPAKVRERANRGSRGFDSIYKPGFEIAKVAVGDNIFRICPPTWENYNHYAYEVYIHFGVGTKGQMYLCPCKMLGKKCPACEMEQEYKDAGDIEEAKKVGAKENYIAWVLDRNAEDSKKPRLWRHGYAADRDISIQRQHPRTNAVLNVEDPDLGYDLIFKRKGTGLKTTEYYGWQFDRDSSPLHKNEKIKFEIWDYIKKNPIPDVLNFYSYEHLAGVISGTVAERDEHLDEDPPFETEPENVRSRSQAMKEQEEYVDPDTGEVTEDPPSRRVSTRANGNGRHQVDEPVNEEQEEVPPPRATRRLVVEEDGNPPPRRRVR